MSTAAKMTVREFGEALISTGDLDPVYIGLVGANLPEPQLCRWLLAYFCFYHAGAACWLSEQEGDGFWWNLDTAAINKISPRVISDRLPDGRWPRAAERRHFRGQKCVDAVRWLAIVDEETGLYRQPEHWVRSLLKRESDIGKGTHYVDVMERVQRWPMFGKWVAFKAADMMERCYGANVEFDDDIALIYEAPRAGLEHLAIVEGKNISRAYADLLAHFAQTVAPPVKVGGRMCGPQELETVSCKWHSHLNGHYTPGKDIREVRHALIGWGKTAETMLLAMPQEVAS